MLNEPSLYSQIKIGNYYAVLINVPYTLPQERLKQRITELKQSLINEAKFFTLFLKQHSQIDDPWTNSEIALPTTDTGIEDFAINHDHYLYGLDKQ